MTQRSEARNGWSSTLQRPSWACRASATPSCWTAVISGETVLQGRDLFRGWWLSRSPAAFARAQLDTNFAGRSAPAADRPLRQLSVRWPCNACACGSRYGLVQ